MVEKFVQELAAQLADRRVHLEVDALAKAWLGDKGYDPLYGARPLARVIQEHIKRPLADELLFGTLARGGKVVVTIRDGKPAFDCTPASTPALLPPPDDADFGALEDDDGDDEADDQEFLPEIGRVARRRRPRAARSPRLWSSVGAKRVDQARAAGASMKPPPEPSSSAPEMNEASSDSSQRIGRAISSGSAQRLIAIVSAIRARSPASWRTASVMSVSVMPGRSALTRMPSRATSLASPIVKLSIAPLEAA